MKGQDQLLSAESVAARLGLKAVTIRAWACSRRIASVRLGRRRLIPEGEIQRLIDDGFIPAKPERGPR